MKILTALAVGFGAAISAPAAAITAFATFTTTSALPSVDFVGSGNGAGVISSVAQAVTFRFLDPLGGPTPTDFAATFNFTANTAGGVVVGGVGVASVPTGTFSFTSATPVTFAGSTGTNLLSGVFTDGALTAKIGGSVASLFNSTPPSTSTVTFTSDFLDFSQSLERDLSFAINAINPLIAASSLGGGVANFSGTISGNFGADVIAGNGLPVVPEPGTWLLMIAGFGLVGTAMRRRSTMISVTS